MRNRALSPERLLLPLNIILGAALIIGGLMVARNALTLALSPAEKRYQVSQRQAPLKEARKTLDHYAPLLSNNVFGFPAGKLRPLSTVASCRDKTDRTAPAEVGIILRGTVASADGTDHAIVEVESGDQSVYATGEHIAVNWPFLGLQVIDISNPARPTAFLSSYNTGTWAWGVTIANNLAYVADWISGLQIIDLSISSQFEPVDFINANINLWIDSPTGNDMTLTVSADRSDIISIGSYPSALRATDYRSGDIVIPITYIVGATGQTVITLTLNHAGETLTRTVYFNVY